MIFEDYRRYLFSIAYRMLGTVMDAEDMVQECWLKWQAADRAAVKSPKGFLATMITRLCIDHLRSAKAQRESYIGPWLPEPLLTDKIPTVEETAALADTLSTAFLLLLERLPPVERAAFLLREVFDYPYDEIADVLEKSPANCRKIVSRAKKPLSPDLDTHSQPGFIPSPEKQEALITAFFQSVINGDLAGLTAMLAEDAVAITDSGGKATAAKRPIFGGSNVAKFFLGLRKQAPENFTIGLESINGQRAIAIYENGRATSLISFVINEAGRITAAHNWRNPDKLGRIPKQNTVH